VNPPEMRSGYLEKVESISVRISQRKKRGEVVDLVLFDHPRVRPEGKKGKKDGDFRGLRVDSEEGGVPLSSNFVRKK